jgi:hypothetical protein
MDAQLKPQSKHRKIWLKRFLVFLSPSSNCRDSTSIRPRRFTFKRFCINKPISYAAVRDTEPQNTRLGVTAITKHCSYICLRVLSRDSPVVTAIGWKDGVQFHICRRHKTFQTSVINTRIIILRVTLLGAVDSEMKSISEFWKGIIKNATYQRSGSRDSSVGIVTGYGIDD